MGFPELDFCDLPQQQQHAHNLTYKKRIPSHNLHLIQASNANTRRLFVSIAYCLERHREGEDKKQKTKRHKHNNKTQDTKTKRIRCHSCSEGTHLLLFLLLLHSAMANNSSRDRLFVARRPAISTVTKPEIIQKLKRKIW